MAVLSAAIVALLISATPTEANTSPDKARATIERAIPVIQEGGVDWIDQRDCVSCHRVGNMVWSLSAARRKGFKVDAQLDEWLDWSVESSLATNDKDKIVATGNREGAAQLLITLAMDRPERHAEHSRKLAEVIATEQQEGGAWKAGGQLPFQKRDAEETNAVSTMWITLGLLSQPEQGAYSKQVEKALEFIEQSQAGESTEWYAARLLIAKRRNQEEQVAKMVAMLRQRQQEDGGWPWLAGDTSDALGTGLALYALLEAGLKTDDPAIERAQQFLISTQRDDGSWAVKGTKAKKKDKIEETAVYWGTTWATLALVRGID